MDWQSLGSLTLTYQWQELPLEVDHTELFRLTHLGEVPATGKGWIAQSFGVDAEIYGVQTFYPVGSYQPIYKLSIPDDFILRGFTSRKIALKIATFAPVPKIDWTVQVQKLIALDPPQKSTVEQIAEIRMDLARIEYKLDSHSL